MVDIELRKHEKAAELLLSGRIDSITAPALEKSLLESAQLYDDMTLDFTKVAYISSAGLRTLMKLHKTMRGKGGRFAIKNVSKDVMDVFRVTGMNSLIDIQCE